MSKIPTLKNPTQEKRLFKYRLVSVIVFIFLLVMILLGRLFYLQIIQHRYYLVQSNDNKIDFIPVSPRRGLIYDRHGEILAKNIPVFDLVVTPDRVKHLKEALKNIQSVISLSQADLDQFHKQLKQHRPFEQIPLKIELTDQEMARFAVNRYRFPGFSIQGDLIRDYPLGKAFAHVLGYVGRINEQELTQIDADNYAGTNFIGKVGIERYYEPQLHGEVGYEKIEKDVSGHLVRVLERNPPVSGSNLYLTIDAKLQLVAEHALGKNRGAVVAIQPSTGQVLALVSKPAYDPNLFVTGISNKDYQKLQDDPARPLYNRSIRGLYAPGSTVKPFIALEGLRSNTVTASDRIFDPGWYKIPNTKHIFHDWKKLGWVDMKKAIIQSCDTYFFYLAYKLGIDRLDQIFDEFGFGKNTGIDMGEELPGNIPTPKWKMSYVGLPWYTGDTVICGIGQSYIQVTPLQLAVAAATLANRGKAYTPYLLKALHSPHHPLANQLPMLKNEVQVPKRDWNTVIHAMSLVTRLGTGYHFGRSSPYTVASKTGTAQVVSHRIRNFAKAPYNIRPNYWFMAFAPVRQPKIALVVLTEHASEAPAIARKIMDYYLLKERI